MVYYCERKISSLSELKPGDHVKSPCTHPLTIRKDWKHDLHVWHHALVVEVLSDKEAKVIHNNGKVCEATMTYESLERVTVLEYPCSYSPEEAIERARTKLGKKWVFNDTCEHLVTWAKSGEGRSVQVRKCVVVGVVGSVVGAVFGTLLFPGVGTLVGGVLGFFGTLYIYTLKAR